MPARASGKRLCVCIIAAACLTPVIGLAQTDTSAIMRAVAQSMLEQMPHGAIAIDPRIASHGHPSGRSGIDSSHDPRVLAAIHEVFKGPVRRTEDVVSCRSTDTMRGCRLIGVAGVAA